MARRIKEIKNFNIGLVTNADSREVPDEGALYSNNVDANSAGGVLKGHKKDRLKGEMDWVNILSAASGTGGANYTKITCSTTSHNVTDGAKVKIVGTTNYNGYWTASNTSGARFDINTAYVSSESATIITGVTATAADPTVFTKEGHTLATGDTVELSGFNEMTEVNGLRGIVTNLTADTFEVNGIAADPAEITGGTVTKIGGVASTDTGQVKLQTSDTYARLRFDSGTKINMGGTISVNVTDMTVDDGSVFRKDEIIAIGTGVFKINAVIGNILYTDGTWYGTFNGESAPFSDDATVYKTSNPIAVESYLDVSDSSNVRENIILFNNSGRIDGIEDFTSSDTEDTIGAGINSQLYSSDFSKFPIYIPNINSDRITIVNKFGNYFIGAGKKNLAMYLGKSSKKSLVSDGTFFLTHSKLLSPDAGINGNSPGFTKVLTYKGTDNVVAAPSNTSLFRPADSEGIVNITRVIHVAFIKDTPYLYMIDGDTGKVHITQSLGYNIQAIAKVVSTIKGIKVWVYRKDVTEDVANNPGFEDIANNPGFIDCIELFDLDATDFEPINPSETITTVGLPFSVHQTIDCQWGGTSTTWTSTNSAYATDGYESRPAYEDTNKFPEFENDEHNIEVYISDILETVDTSRKGMLWLLASPKIGLSTSDDPAVSYMRGGIHMQETSGHPIVMSRFIWASWSKADNSEAIDGDIEAGTTSTKYFTDKSMPIHHIVDQVGSATQIDDCMYRRHYGYNNQGMTLRWLLPKRSIGTAAGTAHTPIAKPGSTDQWANHGKYQKEIIGGTGSGGNSNTWATVGEGNTTSGMREDEWNTGQLVSGGSFWYLHNSLANRINRANSNTQTGDHSFRQWALFDFQNVPYKERHSSSYINRNNLNETFWGNSSNVMTSSGWDQGVGGAVKAEVLKFAPIESSLVDVSDLYPGVDHVVTCLVHVHRGIFTEDLWQTVYHDNGDQQAYQWNSHSGYRLKGCRDKTILWTTNGHPNNTGALYVNSNSYGFSRTPGSPDANSSDLTMYDNYNLSTLCYDNVEDVIRVMKVLWTTPIKPWSESGAGKFFISMARNYHYSMYQFPSDTARTYNDSGLCWSSLWISTHDRADNIDFSHGSLNMIRLSTLPEGGNAIKGLVRHRASTEPTTLMHSSYGSDSGYGGYSNNEGTITDSSFTDNAGATDAHQLYPSNHSAMVNGAVDDRDQGLGFPNINLTETRNDRGGSGVFNRNNTNSFGVRAAVSKTWFNDGVGHHPYWAIPRAAACLNAWMKHTNNLSHSSNFLTESDVGDTNTRKSLWLGKVHYNSFNYDELVGVPNTRILRNVYWKHQNVYLLDDEAMFLRADTFQLIAPYWHEEYYASSYGTPAYYRHRGQYHFDSSPAEGWGEDMTGYSTITQFNIKQEDEGQIFSSLSSSDSSASSSVTDLSHPLIIDVPVYKPANSSGTGADDFSAYNRYHDGWLRLSLLNKVGRNKLFFTKFATANSIGSTPLTHLNGDNSNGIKRLPGWEETYTNNLGGPTDLSNEDNLEANPYEGIALIDSQYRESAISDAWLDFKFFDNWIDSTNGDLSNFPNDYIKKYKLSIEYDGTMESVLSSPFSMVPNELKGDDGSQLWPTQNFNRCRIIIKLPKEGLNPRATAIVLWRQGTSNRSNPGEFYQKVKEIQLTTTGGWKSILVDGINYIETEVIDGSETEGLTSNGDYSHWNGISENYPSPYLDYGIATVANDYLFVSDIGHLDIDKGEYKVARSLKGKFSMFDWQDSILTLNDTVTALKGYSNKLYIFTKKQIMRINPDELITEDVLDGFGCGNNNAVVTTEYGMFFGDKSHAYVHDGSSVQIISYPIETDDFSGESNGWQDKITDTNFKTYFFSKTNLVAFVFEKTAPSKSVRQEHGAFTYHVLKKRWDYREFYLDGTSGLNSQPAMGELLFQSKINDRIYYFSGPTNGIYTSDISTLISEWGGDSVDDNFSWMSKDMTMDADNIDKRFVKLKIEANRELNVTPTVYIDDVAVTLTSIKTNEWRINQKGKKMRIKLSSSSSTVTPANETTTIFSIGVIYRSTKVK